MVVYLLFLLILILPVFVAQVESSTSTNTLYAHAETTTIGGVNYYLHKLLSANGPATTLYASAASTGRKLMGRWVYSLNGIVSVPASTLTVTYRAMRSANASSVVAHGDIDILIRKSDNTIRTTIATNVANSPSLTLVNTWETLTGTYNWAAYTVVDQTDYLEVAYYIEVTTPQSSKQVRLLVDDNALPLADQTKIENVIFTYPNQAPVASFTFSPSNPLIYDPVTFNASASYDPDGSIVSYKWDFGDGNITTVTNPIIVHVYTTALSTVNYTVTLTVTDNEGSTGSTSQIVPVTNPSILYVSLPAGTYVGPDPDNWLSQCWLLNISDVSATFTVRINNTHASYVSYNTHLIIALNNASYDYLSNLTVDSTTIPKASFTYGTPQPYGFDLTWEEDVYPTWFNYSYVVGDIDPKSYKDAQVSITFSNATGVRVHFDAYGSTESPPPPKGKGRVTHNPHEKDSTVLFSPLVVVQYYLTVRTDPVGVVTILGEGWYPASTNVTLTAPTPVSNVTGVQYRFSHWDVDGSNVTGNPIVVHMNQSHTATAHYVKQYELIMSTNFGTTSPPVGSHWYDENSVVPISATAPSVIDGESYVWLGWTGTGTISYTGMDNPASVTMNSPINETASWRHEYRLTMATNYGTTTPPVGDHWYEAGSIIEISATPPGAIEGERYVWNGWTGTGNGSYSTLNNPANITMNGPITETASWTHQYRLTMATNFGTTDPSVGEHWYDAGSVVPILATAPSVVDGERYVWLGWTGTGTISYTGMDNPANVTMNSPINETAAWRHEYRLTMATNYGTTTPSVGEHWYEAGSIVEINATSPSTINGERYVWNGWTGTGAISYTGMDNPATVTMNSPITQTASWMHQFLLTIKTSGLPSAYPTKVYLGGLQVGTASDASPYTKWFDSGTSTGTIGVDSTVSGATDTRYVFIKWIEDSSTNNPRASETMNSPKNFTAEYKTQYYLTVNTNPAEVLTLNPAAVSGQGWYDSGDTATVDAVQNVDKDAGQSRYDFRSWTGATPTGLGNQATVLMDGPKTATANYQLQYKITFNQSGVGADFTGTIVTIDGTGHNISALPAFFWWDKDSNHTFSFSSPLIVNASKQYVWISTSGLSTLQNGTLTITGSGSVTGNYTVQAKYQITFRQTGVSPDFTGTVVVVDGVNYNVAGLPISFMWDAGSPHTFAFQSPLVVTPNAKRYVWTSTTGLSTLQNGSITVSTSGDVTGNYKTQYYLTVTSPYDTPTPTSGWFDVGSITASVTSPWPGPAGTRYICTGWNGNGSVPASGTTTTVTFTINQPSSITWNWKTQYYLTVKTNPLGITTIPGEGWYDQSAPVGLTAPPVPSYNFNYWDVDGTSQGSGVNSITVHMNAPHTATAHYKRYYVGGYTFSVEKPRLVVPTTEFFSELLAAMAVTVMLIKLRSKKVDKTPKTP